MPTLSITKSYQDGDILLEADLDNIRDAVTTFLNTTKIDTDNIQTSGVATANIANSAVTTAKIADSNVTTAKIADSNVTTAKIADSNITNDKMADNSVNTAELVDLCVTSGKLAAGAVVSGKIGAAAITASELAGNCVTTVKILDANVTADKLASNSVTTDKITDSNVTTAKLANASVTLAKQAVQTTSQTSDSGTGTSVGTIVVNNQSVSHTNVAGRPVIINLIPVDGFAGYFGGGAGSFELTLRRDSNAIAAWQFAASTAYPASLIYVDDEATAGAHTYDLVKTGNDMPFYHIALKIIEI